MLSVKSNFKALICQRFTIVNIFKDFYQNTYVNKGLAFELITFTLIIRIKVYVEVLQHQVLDLKILKVKILRYINKILYNELSLKILEFGT